MCVSVCPHSGSDTPSASTFGCKTSTAGGTKVEQGVSCWGGGYDEDGCWDDARAQHALRTTREAREDAKKAEAERKRAAALAQQAARRTAARPPPAKRPRAATAVAPPTNPGRRRERHRAPTQMR